MKTLPAAIAFAAMSAIAGAEARACSYGPNYVPPTQEQRDEALRQRYAQSDALLEVVAVRGSAFDRPGRMQVLRVYKGNVAVGSEFSLRAFIPTSCSAVGNFARGSRGLILIRRLSEPLFFPGYLSLEEFATLQRGGLLGPPRDR